MLYLSGSQHEQKDMGTIEPRSRISRLASASDTCAGLQGWALLQGHQLDNTRRQLGVSTRTIYTLARKGTLPATRVGRQWRFARQKLIQWVAAEVRSINSPPH